MGCASHSRPARWSSAITRTPWFRWLALREIAAARAPTLAELFALLGRHLHPTLIHALAHSPAHIGARAAATPASEENPAESQQSESLPESNLMPSEERRSQPVQGHHQFATDPDEKRDREYRCWDDKKPFLSVIHIVLPYFLLPLLRIVFLFISWQIRRKCFAIVRVDVAPRSVCARAVC